MIPKNVTRQSGSRAMLEKNVLEAYNHERRKKPQPSPTEAYTTVALQFGKNYYQIQYIILKARKEGKKVL